MNEEKNKYIYPEIELIVVGEDDIISTSDGSAEGVAEDDPNLEYGNI